MSEASREGFSGTPTNNYSGLSDVQLSTMINQISAAGTTYVAPVPQQPNSKPTNYQKNLQSWSNTPTPPPRNASAGTRNTRSRATPARPSNLTSTSYAPTPVPVSYTPQTYQPAYQLDPAAWSSNQSRALIPTTVQAGYSTYASRLRTGATLLMQPILQTPTVTTTRSSRRGGVVNYADPGSGDDLPDAGALDSDDSDFVATGGVRSSVRQSRTRMNGARSSPQPNAPKPESTELDQTYLGMVPPARFMKSKGMALTLHEYPPPETLERQAQKRTALVPVRVEFETETHRIRDCFVWNVNEESIKPETFARIFCTDLELPLIPWADTIANQIKAQLEDHEGVATMELGLDSAIPGDTFEEGGDISECRVILSIDVQIANYHLSDHIEWDLLSPLTPEIFSRKLCDDIGLSGEAVPLVAHAIHEELIKHKKDAIEWGVIGASDREMVEDSVGGEGTKRDRSGLVKDKTGLGLGWGRAPRDGRLPKPLRSVWRDWVEAEEFRTRFEVLTAEEVERREVEKERASRRLRRETSKFQSSTRSRRR